MSGHTSSRDSSWRAAVPGLCLAFVLALSAKVAAQELGSWLMHGSGPPVSPVLFAVLLGVLWRNLVGVGRRAEQGVRWVMHTLLRVGIALVGLRLTLHGVTSVGLTALPVALGCIIVAMVTSVAVGRALGISNPLLLLIAVGTAVCGCTAVVAATPATRARPEEAGVALMCVVLIGSIGMLAYPWLAAEIFGTAALPAGLFLGTAIHDTSQVLGASLIFAQQFGVPDVVAVAGVTKLVRNLSILVLVPLLAWVSRERSVGGAAPATAALQRSQVFPDFVVWFVLLVIVRTVADAAFETSPAASHAWSVAVGAVQSISELLLVCGMTAVGLSISASQFRGAGWRPLCTAVVVAVAVALCSLFLIHAIGHDVP